jgi:hypothetical protein
MPTATDDDARDVKKDQTDSFTEQLVNALKEWSGTMFYNAAALIAFGIVLLVGGLYVGALFSSPVVTLLATMAAILVFSFIVAVVNSGA